LIAAAALAFSSILAGQGSPNAVPGLTSPEALPAASGLSSYQGLSVREIRFPDLSDADQETLRKLIPQKAGQPFDRDLVRQSMQALHATGRFADLRAEAERSVDGEVTLTFISAPNYFIGDIRVDGNPTRPTANQVINASKLQLGDPFGNDKIERAHTGIQRLMQENGYYKATIADEETKNPQTQQMSIRFHLKPGPQARIGRVNVTGNPVYSAEQVQDIAKMHPGDNVSAQRVSNALDRMRKKFQKKNRLLAQVSITDRVYHAESNTVDYTLDVEPGPTVDIVAEGSKISRNQLKKSIPVFEENALDDDLLNEGRRNLLNYLQTRGYFEAKVGYKKHNDPQNNELRVIYIIDEGARHKLVKVEIKGNKYFATDVLRPRMQLQPASRLFAQGRYNQNLLNADVHGLENLYRTNGFQQVKVTGNAIDNYEGQPNTIAVEITIDEGAQTLVGDLHIEGNHVLAQDDFPPLNTAPGQPFSESTIAADRDILLNFYFNNGFPDATFDATAKPDAGKPNHMDVTFNLHEGEQVFVDKVLISGLHYTKPFIIQREVKVKSGDPLSQLKMLKTQQSLYDLGIFSQVDTAIQNPNGVEPQKNVLIDIQEAKRYTFNYGIGLEFQTGTPAVGTTEPQGAMGVSPRVSLDVTRLNLRGRDHTVTFKGHVGRLQQRALVSYDAPRWFNSTDWRLTLTAFYDNTLDVTTFTSQRLEGSVQAEETLSKASTMFYRFTYRRVKATNIEVTQDLIPLFSLPTRVGMPGFTYIRDKRDNPLESTKGNYTTIDGGLASGYFGSEADFSRALIQNTTYHAFGKNRPLDRKFVFARSTRIGVENNLANTYILNPGEPCPHGLTSCAVIPLPERFFSGGGNTHRGFGLNQAGPRDPTTGFPLGGAAVFVNNLELRFPPANLPYFRDNLSFAVFEDAGNVFTAGHNMVNSLLRWNQPNPALCRQASTRNQCDYNYISHAVGVGVRYKTPIGPVRFDFGYNLNPPYFPSCQSTAPEKNSQTTWFCPTSSPYFNGQRTGRFNVYFSIGQTF
jgi:outer membrane protein assembly complex protein YaeT